MGAPGPAGPQVLTYPVGLRLRGRLAVVVGGGATAERLVRDLSGSGARVLVIAEALSPGLADLAGRRLISASEREYRAGDLDGAWLVLACAQEPSVNAAVAADAERQRVWCASADDEVGGSALLPRAVAGDPGPRAGHRVLVLGGARSGKSATAEAMLAGAGPVDYIATSHRSGRDAEWSERISVHQARRPAHWRTIETLDLTEALALAPGPAGPPVPALIDCLATWLAQMMDDCGIWAGGQDADGQLDQRLDALVEAWRQTSRQVVAVSNEVGSGIVPATASGRRFRDELGRLNARLAAGSDQVWLCTAGIAQRLR